MLYLDNWNARSIIIQWTINSKIFSIALALPPSPSPEKKGHAKETYSGSLAENGARICNTKHNFYVHLSIASFIKKNNV